MGNCDKLTLLCRGRKSPVYSHDASLLLLLNSISFTSNSCNFEKR